MSQEETKAGSELSRGLDAALNLHEERFKRIVDAWLREESAWIAGDVERFRYQHALERIAGITGEPGQQGNRGVQIENIGYIAREALSA